MARGASNRRSRGRSGRNVKEIFKPGYAYSEDGRQRISRYRAQLNQPGRRASISAVKPSAIQREFKRYNVDNKDLMVAILARTEIARAAAAANGHTVAALKYAWMCSNGTVNSVSYNREEARAHHNQIMTNLTIPAESERYRQLKRDNAQARALVKVLREELKKTRSLLPKESSSDKDSSTLSCTICFECFNQNEEK